MSVKYGKHYYWDKDQDCQVELTHNGKYWKITSIGPDATDNLIKILKDDRSLERNGTRNS